MNIEVSQVSVHFQYIILLYFISYFPLAIRFGGIPPTIPYKCVTKPSVDMEISYVYQASLTDP